MRSAESRSKSSWKKRPGKTLILGAILALVSLAVVYGRESLWNGGFIQKFISYLEMSQEQRIPTIIATPQDYTVTARAEGVLVGLYSVPVLAPRVRSGPMRIAWLAPEGNVVARGETLVRFDETDARLSLEQGQNQLETQSHRIENSTVRQTGEIRQLEMEQQSADLERSYSESQIRKDETIFSRWEIRESLMDANLAESRLAFLSNREGLQEELGESQLRELTAEKNQRGGENRAGSRGPFLFVGQVYRSGSHRLSQDRVLTARSGQYRCGLDRRSWRFRRRIAFGRSSRSRKWRLEGFEWGIGPRSYSILSPIRK